LDDLETLTTTTMLHLPFAKQKRPLRVLCLGAHSDDIEIGCGGLLLRLLGETDALEVCWAVLSATGDRAKEATLSAKRLLGRGQHLNVMLGDLRDSYFPADFGRAKEFFRTISTVTKPDVVFTHYLSDRHQDHRLVAELTWQTWRNCAILEYEIPKYEGDLAQPNLFSPLPAPIVKKKISHLMRHFESQRSRQWFTRETFEALMRLRGIECRAPSGYAEAFHARKLCI
jgi:LmbE family N-acetylglucosaminyl deacetylase